jgi:CRP-like cAMP-binding protein
MKDTLRTVLKMFADFSGSELDTATACFRPRTVAKHTLLLQEGNTCNEFYFVSRGCIRTFFRDRNEREKTRYVLLDNHIGTALASFITRKPSIECIEAIEETALLAIHHADFYRLTREMKSWSDFYQRILEMAYSFQNEKIEQLVTLTARQRYEKLLHEKPVMVQRLSNRVLASYLDIREETLSRIKSP